MEEEKSKTQKYVSPYDPIQIPVWVWGVVFFGLFLLFVFGVYYATKAEKYQTQSSLRQHYTSGGLMKTQGAI